MSQFGKAMSKKKYYENVILIKYNVDNALKIAKSLCEEVWGECQCCGINNPPEVEGCIRYNLQKMSEVLDKKIKRNTKST